jgi:creatinine amidohydrolase
MQNMGTSETLVLREKTMSDYELAHLRPDQIVQRLRRKPVVFIPVGPLEWHGPHMPYGTDALNAAHLSDELCRRAGGLLWPTLFWGAERERRPDQLRSLGFPADQYVVGMDFPANSIKSCYCPEEVLAVLMREVLREARQLGARLAVIINGHGATNQIATLKRLAIEISNTTDLKVCFRIAGPLAAIQAGSGGHADSDETSLMMHLGEAVDLKRLPALPEPLAYANHAVVDGGGFDGKSPDHLVPERCDPRRQASAGRGRELYDITIAEIEDELKPLLANLSAKL